MAQQVTLKLVMAAIVIGLLSCLCVVLIVTGPTARLTSVSPSKVQLFYANELGLPRQAAAADQIYSLAQKRTLPSGGSAQYQISLDGFITAKADKIGVIVTSMGAPGVLFLNAIGISQTKVQMAPSSSRGGYWLSAALTVPRQESRQARLDLIVDETDAWGLGVGGIKIGSLAEIERATALFETVQQRRLVVFAVFALLGLGFSIFCLMTRLVWAGGSGLLFSGVLLIWCFSHIFDFGPIAITATRVAYILGTIAAVLAVRAFSGRLGGVWLGLGCFAVTATLSGMWGWRVGMSFDLVATLVEVAPAAICGVGLPLCLGTGTLQLMNERTQAQAEARAQAAIVAAQSQELDRQADRQAVTEERKRFARDIHDGIGGQLVSLLWRVRAEPIPQDELAAEIEQGLADLRLVVDALDEGPVSLPIALANFAYRARAQLQAANISFEWDLPRDFDVYWSDSRQILSLYRILQETVSNVMRHAQAKNLAIRFAGADVASPDKLSVTIEDDGRGFDAATTPSGRGLANMRTRAAQIGGVVNIRSPILPVEAPISGTRIEIVLPTRVAIG